MSTSRLPLTPPPTQAPNHHQSNLDLVIAELGGIEDMVDVSPNSDYIVKQYLLARCPGLDIPQFLSTHNRVTIPIEEDFQLLRRLKRTLEEAPDDDAHTVMMGVIADVHAQRTESDKKCDRSRYEHLIGTPFNREPLLGKWWALLRSMNLLSINDSIIELFPHLFKELKAKQAHEPTKTSSSPPAKKATKSYRVEKSTASKKKDRGEYVPSAKKRRLQLDGTNARSGKVDVGAQRRRSPRLSHAEVSSKAKS